MRQIYDKKLLCKHILDIVNKTNLIDYTMDIRTRLGMDSVVPEELAARKAKVLATLSELTAEVAPITAATEKLKDTDHMKDSKTFLNILQKEYDVSATKLPTLAHLIDYALFTPAHSSRTSGCRAPTRWASTCTSAAATRSPSRTCTSA